MRTQLMLPSVLLAAVLLSAAWIILSFFMIWHMLFPDQQILITASKGVELKVEDGVLHLLNGSAKITHYHPRLILALAIPFTIILAAAVAGCITIFRKADDARSL